MLRAKKLLCRRISRREQRKHCLPYIALTELLAKNGVSQKGFTLDCYVDPCIHVRIIHLCKIKAQASGILHLKTSMCTRKIEKKNTYNDL